LKTKKIQIGVIGHSDEKLLNKKILHLAEKVGEEVAKNNSILICGGMEGVMEAAAKGAKNKKGYTIGIIPFGKHQSIEGNDFLDCTIHTGMDFSLRANLVVFSSDGIIAVSGGSGTLSELAIAYMYEIPVVLLRNSEGWANKIPLVLDERNKRPFLEANSPEEAVSKLMEKINKKNGHRKP